MVVSDFQLDCSEAVGVQYRKVVSMKALLSAVMAPDNLVAAKRQPRRTATTEELRRLLSRLDPDPERGWELYERLRRKLILFFERNRGWDAVELAEEVLDRLAKKGEAYEIRNAGEFAFGVARNLRKEALRRASTTFLSPDLALVADPRGVAESLETAVLKKIEDERRLDCISKCLGSWDEQERRLFLEYYPLDAEGLEAARRRIATRLEITIGTLRTRMCRLREKLQTCFEACCANGYRQRDPQ
jgi:RNA polymerase sigma factor (sigma-70 family)